MGKKSREKTRVTLIEDGRATTSLVMRLETCDYHVQTVSMLEESAAYMPSDTDIMIFYQPLSLETVFGISRRVRLNVNTQDIPLILVGKGLTPQNVVDGLYIGLDDCIRMPCEDDELIARIEAVLRRVDTVQSTFFDEERDNTLEELKKIIKEELIMSYFQPIYLLESNKVYGVEALARPQTKTKLANPEILFKLALKFGLYHELERVSWVNAIKMVASHLSHEKLFLNCNPYLVESPKFLSVRDLFSKASIGVENTVLEITERSAINNYKEFFKLLSRYRDYGFKFAVDDVGGGYASLESIVETRPEVVKLDRHIVHLLHTDEFKRSIVRFIVSFCRENNILLIAEGIETKEELKAVKELGVEAGQGYYLCRPTPHIDIKAMNNF